jgi:hypothetical protein
MPIGILNMGSISVRVIGGSLPHQLTLMNWSLSGAYHIPGAYHRFRMVAL